MAVRMLVDDQPGDSGFVAQPIEVNIRAIEDFAALLGQELDANFRPTQDRVVRQHSDGVGFGSRHASLDMRMAVHKYYDCLSAAVDNLREFVAASGILIEAAQKIAAAYRSAEEDAQTRQRNIDQALRDAAQEAAAARQGAIDEATRAAMHRRLARYQQEQ